MGTITILPETKPMKAYAVTDKNCDGYTYIVYAETRGKAIRYALDHCDGAFDDYEWTEIWATRRPSLDKYYHGRRELDWMDMGDRTIMVREAGFYCDYDTDVTGECADCPAHKYCQRYERMTEDEKWAK